MFTILFATDGSPAAIQAGRFLESLDYPPGSRIHILSVVYDRVWPLPVAEAPLMTAELLGQVHVAETEGAEQAVGNAVASLSRMGVDTQRHVRNGEPAHEIITAAEEFAADLVVIGATGHTGLQGFFLGSVATNVARHARRPVLVARDPGPGVREVLIGTDGSKHAVQSLDLCRRLPLPAGAAITVATVIRPYHPFAGLVPADLGQFEDAADEVRNQRQVEGRALVDAAVQALARPGTVVRGEVRTGDPASELLKLADERSADLIIVGARGGSLIQGLLMGSVADRLLSRAKSSVLVVH